MWKCINQTISLSSKLVTTELIINADEGYASA